MTYLLHIVLQRPRSTTIHAQNASEVGVIIENDVTESQSTLNLTEYSTLDPGLRVLCDLFLLNAGWKTRNLAARYLSFDP
ncbi:hypothetical protein MKW92_040751, partial [Papaver armeniacum]